MDLLKDTSIILAVGPLLGTDGITAKTGLAYGDVTVTLRKAGAVGVEKTLGVSDWTEDSGGYYILALDADDTDTLRQLRIGITASAMLPYFEDHEVVAGLDSAVGPGAIALPVIITDVVTGLAVVDAEVWVTTDAAGANTIAGTLRTNASGQAIFYLDAGTYYVWAAKVGDYDFANPKQAVVS